MNNPISHEPIPMKPKRKGGKYLPILITVIVGLVMFYFTLPALNFQAQEFYSYIIFLLLVYAVFSVPKLFRGMTFHLGQGLKFDIKSLKGSLWPVYAIAALVVFNVAGQLIASPIIRAKDYKELLPITESNFVEDVQNVNYSQIPLLDKVSAQMLGRRKLGELSDMVSQFEVAEDYAQINYKERPVRVTPLEYGDFFKWITNRSKGIPAYLIIDMIDQDVEVVRLGDNGIKYSPSEPFGRNTYRYLRFKYPTFMFDSPSFELNEEGTPYWIVPRLEKRIGLFGGTDVKGAVLLNAITGETEYLDAADVPRWVDRVYSADLIIGQYDFYGKYQNGFFNTIFSQKGMRKSTQGYNYLAMDDDVYVYTGVTSVGRDQGNIGFILANQRTKETKYYQISGADEYSAMDSAEGVVQHLGYVATFPLLINVNGQPTYIMALKDNAQLVKMYAMVNVSSYQIVATGETVSETEKKYRERLAGESLPMDETTKLEVSGVIADIRSYVMEGNTIYLVRLENDNLFYKFDPRTDESAVLLNVGDVISFSHYPVEGFMPIIPAENIKMG